MLNRRRNYILILTALLMCMSVLSRTAGAATLTVNSLADTVDGICDTSCSLRDAVNSSSAGDTIDFAVTGTITLLYTELYITHELTITGPGARQLVVSGNNASAVFSISGAVTVTMSGFSISNGSTPSGAGGAIWNNGATINLTDMALTGNAVSTSSGGAIYNNGVMNLDRVTLANNSAAIDGGAIYNETGAALTIKNSTISGNNGGQNAGGISNAGVLTIYNTTIANNTGTMAGAVANFGTAFLYNALIASNSPNDYSNIAPATAHNNLVQNPLAPGDWSGNGNIVGSSPLIGALANNGGATDTLALLTGSPAIDAGEAGTCLPIDQRGTTRPQGPACDIGSFELVSLNTLTVSKTGVGAGTVRSRTAGIACGGTCAAGFAKDAIVTLTAAPDAGSYFTGWSGDACVGNTSLTCMVTMDAAKSVTADFTTTPPAVQTWAKTFGGIGSDSAHSIEQTADGGYLVSGLTNSFGAGSYDSWALKVDANGAIAWQKTYGGAGVDMLSAFKQTADSGYVMAGKTTSFGAGGYDVWVVKLNADGTIAWEKTFGGTADDEAYSVAQTEDGGYVVAAFTMSFGSGNGDAWMLKLNPDGTLAWQKAFGGGSTDKLNFIEQTADGGYVMAGNTYSYDLGNGDAWVLKLDAGGTIVWEKTFGGAVDDDRSHEVHQTADGGYLLSGYTYLASSGLTLSNAWALKLNPDGTPAGQKTIAGTQFVEQTTDGGYVVAGITDGTDAVDYDLWVLKIDAGGTIAWNKTFGGAGYDSTYGVPNSFQQTADGGYVVAGITRSFGLGAPFPAGSDAWVLKLNADGDILGCPGGMVGTKTTTVADTTTSTTDSSATIIFPTVTPADSTATVTDTNVTPGGVCTGIEVLIENATDNNSLTWTTGGDVNWFGQTFVTHDGVDAAQSGAITDSQMSWMETTVTGPVQLSYWWKVSSEDGYDYLRVYLDGLEQAAITGEVDWQQKSVSIPAGEHTVRWEYSKDSSASNGSDAGWVDQVEICDGSYSVLPAYPQTGFGGGPGLMNVNAVSGSCAWTAVSENTWITITGGASGAGTGVVDYTVNSGPELLGAMNIAGQKVPVTRTGAGGLDTTFNAPQGYVISAGTSTGGINASAVQPDGKIVVAGSTFNGLDDDLLVARFNADGTLDTSFNGTGVFTYNNAIENEADYANGIALLSDESIVVVGSTYRAGSIDSDILALRLTSTGQLDTTFGTNGVFTHSVTGSGYNNAGGVAIQSDGGIVIAGTADTGLSNDILVSRLTPAGQLDAAFGTNGVFTHSGTGYKYDSASGVVIQSDGGIVIAGSIRNTVYDDIFVSRLTTTGQLDTTFNSTGVFTYNGTGNNSDSAIAAALQADGRIVVAGRTYNGINTDLLVSRITTTGLLDTTFNTNGVVTYNGPSTYANSLAIQANGGIVVVGDSDNGTFEARVLRFSSDGQLDTSFGYNGVALFNPSASGDIRARAVAIQSDGRLVVTGSINDGINDAGLILRLTASGAVPPAVVGTSPANGATNVPVNTTITVTFNEAMDPATITTANVLVNGGVVAGTLNYDSISSTATFTPSSSLAYSTLYTAMVTTGAKDLAGNALVSDYTWTFTTGLDAPTNVMTYPDNGQITLTWNNVPGAVSYNIYWATASGVTTLNGTKLADAAFAWSEYYYHTGLTNGTTYYYIVTAVDANGEGIASSEVFATPLILPPTAVTGFAVDFLDVGFGYGGIVTTPITFKAAVKQAGGKIAAAGTYLNDFQLTRYNADGSLDTGFGTGGTATTDIGSSSIDELTSLAVQTDNKIVAVGRSADTDFALVRYNLDGSLDTAFGPGGKVTTHVSADYYNWASAVAIQSDDKIVVAGHTSADYWGIGSLFTLVRYNTDGSLDAGFGTGGIVNIDVNGGYKARSVAIQPDGKIVVAGTTSSGFTLVRCNADGSFDSTFGTNGVVSTTLIDGSGSGYASALALQPDGKIVAAGIASSGDYSFALVRFNTDGSLDTTFGASGKASTPGTDNDEPGGVRALAIQPDGKIVAAGPTFTDGFTIVRYNADGGLDMTFGTNGIVSSGILDQYDGAYAMVLGPDGKITAAGIAVVRYNPTAGDSQVTLVWDPTPNADSYNIYWSAVSGVTTLNGTKITGATSPYIHTGLINGTTYYYIVTAVGVGGEGPASAEISATPMAGIPVIMIEPASLFSFGNIGVNLTSSQTFTLANLGNAELVVSEMTLTGAMDYSLDVNSGGTPCSSLTPTIAAGNSCTVQVTFAPLSSGPMNSAFTILSNDPITPSLTTNLTGTGVNGTKSWIGGTGSWSVAGNWSPSGVPGSSDDVILDGTNTYTVTLDTNSTVNSLTLGGTSGTQTLSHSNNFTTLTVNTAATIGANGVYYFSSFGGALTGAGAITIANGGTLDWVFGTIDAPAAATLTSEAGSTVVLTMGTLAANRTWNNSGTVNKSTGNTQGAHINGIVNNLPGGVFILNDANDFGIDGTGTFNNYSEMRKTFNTSTASTGFSPAFNNQSTGVVNVNSGTLSFNGAGSDPAGSAYNVASGAALQFGASRGIAGNISGAGSVSFINPGTLYTLSGDYNVSGGLQLSFGCCTSSSLLFTGTVTNIGTSIVKNADYYGTLDFSGITSGEATGFANLTSMSIYEGATFKDNTLFTSLADLTLNSGTLNLGALSDVALSNLTLNNGTLTGSGAITVKTGGTLNWNAGTMDAAAASTLTTQAGSTSNVAVGALGANRTWNNSGLVTKASPACCSTFVLDGVLNNLSGATIILNDAYTGFAGMGGSGTFNNYGELRKDLNGSAADAGFSPAFNNQSTGVVNVNSGTLSVSGAFTQDGALNIAGNAVFQKSGGFTNNGAISGSGSIDAVAGTLVNSTDLYPGLVSNGTGMFSVTGSFSTSGTIHAELGSATSYDKVAVSSLATLNGALSVSLTGAFMPTGGDSFAVMTYGSYGGSFTTVSLPTLSSGRYWNSPAYNGTSLVLSVTSCPTITLSSLPSGTVGAAYNQAILASGGVASYTYAHSNGTLPIGMSLWSDGTFTGTPTYAGTYTFDVTVTDANACTGTKSYSFTVANTACVTPPAGLVAWWPGEGNAFDAVGNNNGTLVSGATMTANGRVGQAFEFDGANHYLTISDAPALRPASLTLDAWVKFTSAPGTAVIVGKPYGSGWEDSYALWYEGGNLSGAVQELPGAFTPVNYPFTPALNTWYHVAYTYDNVAHTQALYLDGQLVSSGSMSANISYDNNPVMIGAEFSSGGTVGYLPGLVDEVRIYDRVLDASEVASLYNSGSAGVCAIPNAQVTPSPFFDFGSQTLGIASSQTFTITNAGLSDLVVSNITTTGSTDFAIVSGGSATCTLPSPTITAGNSCTFNVTYTPSVASAATGTLAIDSNDPDTPSLVTSLTGTGGYGACNWLSAVNGNWSDAFNWSCGRVPVVGDDVSITVDGNYTVTLDADATVNGLVLGMVSGTNTQALSTSSSGITVNGATTINLRGVLSTNNAPNTFAGSFQNNGVWTMTSSTPVTQWAKAGLTNNGTITMGNNSSPSLTLKVDGVLTNNAGKQITTNDGGQTVIDAVLDNQGLITVGGSHLTLSRASAQHTNSGTINLTTNDMTITQSGTSPSFTNTGSISISSGRTFFVNSGEFKNDGGTLSGTGTLDVSGTTFSNNGSTSPGTMGTAGQLSITGNNAMTASSVVNIDIGGTTQGTQYDKLAVSSTATRAGTLNVGLISGFMPTVGDTFTIMTYSAATGTFSTVNLPALTGGNVWNQVSYNAGSLVLSVVAGDLAAPLTTASPFGGFYNAAQNVTLTCNDIGVSGCANTYYCTGTACSPATLYGGPVFIPATTELRYYSVDGAGNNEPINTETYTIDTTPPALSLSMLPDGSFTNNNTLNAAGTASDTSGIQGLVISSETTTVPQAVTLSTSDNINYTFSYPVTLQTGTNVITLTATDLAGNATTATRTIYLDQAAPVLVITSPADNSATNIADVNVTGTVDKTSTVLVSLNTGSALPANMSGNDFSTSVTLVYGQNTIDVYATDLSGNTTNAKRTVTFDNVNPALSITSPGQDTSTNLPNITISGVISDLSTTTVLVSCPSAVAGSVSYPTSTTWQVDITSLTDGVNAVTVLATDAAGNSTSVIRNIIYDTAAPAVTIDPVTTPTNSDSQAITGTMELNATVTVSCPTANVSAVNYPTGTTWTVDLTLMTEGTNTITVTAADGAGNTSAPVTTSIVYTVLPTFTITASADPNGSITPSGAVTTNQGSNASFSIAPNAGYYVADVIVDGTIHLGAVTSYTFTNVIADHTISASFTAYIVPAFTSISPAQNSVINTTTIGYTLNTDVTSGSVVFTRTGGAADTSHTYTFTAPDMTAGSHSITTGLPLVDGAVYSVLFTADDGVSGTSSVNNVTYDTTAAIVTITAPLSNTYINTPSVSFTLSEAIAAGQIVITRTGGAADGASPYTHTLSGPQLNAGSHTVSTGLALMSGTIYSISFVNVADLVGNASAQVSSLNVTYDTQSVSVTKISPALKSIITDATVGYTLSEDALSGTVTFTRTSGPADGGSPHVYTFSSAELAKGAHTVDTGLVLTENAFYTVTFQIADKAGNPATSVSNAMVFYDYNYGKGPVGNVSNDDGLNIVNDADVNKLKSVMGARPGDANWNPVCDLNKDNKIDDKDMMVLMQHYGE